MSVLSDMSGREKNLWLELFVDVIVAFYYWPKAFMLIQNEAAFSAGAMGGLVVKTIILAIILTIIVAIVASIFFKDINDSELYDERDRQFARRALVFGNAVLVVLIALIIGQIGLSVMIPSLNEIRGIELTPIFIAHLLLISLMLASTVKSCIQLFLYRRGY